MSHARLLRLPERFAGVLVVGDVHGHDRLLAPFVALAGAESLFLVSLGDLTDRGPDSPGVLRLVRRLVEEERGLFLRGNHDDKLFRTLLGRRTYIDEDLADTLDQLHAAPDGRALGDWFRRIYPTMPFVLGLGRTVMVHGAPDPAMLPPVNVFPKRFEALALYGEVTGERYADGRPVRIYRWLDRLPGGLLVIAGHDPLSDEVLRLRTGRSGARLLHLDSGAGQGGPLSAVRLDRRGELLETLQLRPGEEEPRPCPVQPFTSAVPALF
jgi:protein phosphatase